MEHKLIHTEKYLLVVDDSEIKIGNYYLHTQINKIFDCNQNNNYLVLDRDYLKKIIAHLPLNNSTILEGVDLLPPLEDDIFEIAKEDADLRFPNQGDEEAWLARNTGVVWGYNKAKETYKYTEKDLIWAIQVAYGHGHNDVFDGVNKIEESIKAITNYLQQQPRLPIAFECDMEVCETWRLDECNVRFQCCEKPNKPKTTTNSQGQTVWVGKYKF